MHRAAVPAGVTAAAVPRQATCPTRTWFGPRGCPFASALWTSSPAAPWGEELHLAARQAACTSLDPLLKNAVSKETTYETAQGIS